MNAIPAIYLSVNVVNHTPFSHPALFSVSLLQSQSFSSLPSSVQIIAQGGQCVALRDAPRPRSRQLARWCVWLWQLQSAQHRRVQAPSVAQRSLPLLRHLLEVLQLALAPFDFQRHVELDLEQLDSAPQTLVLVRQAAQVGANAARQPPSESQTASQSPGRMSLEVLVAEQVPGGAVPCEQRRQARQVAHQ
eukprot:m.167620 g.167620  ORF g.167620 m.167620 type:complete len:191 (+) comp53176_c0_seq1:471-1043(+)